MQPEPCFDLSHRDILKDVCALHNTTRDECGMSITINLPPATERRLVERAERIQLAFRVQSGPRPARRSGTQASDSCGSATSNPFQFEYAHSAKGAPTPDSPRTMSCYVLNGDWETRHGFRSPGAFNDRLQTSRQCPLRKAFGSDGNRVHVPIPFNDFDTLPAHHVPDARLLIGRRRDDSLAIGRKSHTANGQLMTSEAASLNAAVQ